MGECELWYKKREEMCLCVSVCVCVVEEEGIMGGEISQGNSSRNLCTTLQCIIIMNTRNMSLPQ